MTRDAPEHVVIDASVMVDLLAGTDRATSARTRIDGTILHASAHFDIEVLSALGRLQRAGLLAVGQVDTALGLLQRLPLARHSLTPLLPGAWARRDSLRLTDALYVELAEQTGHALLTTDQRLARGWPGAVAITPDGKESGEG